MMVRNGEGSLREALDAMAEYCDGACVVVDRSTGTETVIKQGVAAGDSVVTDGHLRLVPGARVTVRDSGGTRVGS